MRGLRQGHPYFLSSSFLFSKTMSEKMSYAIARRERPACYPARLTTYAQPWESRDAEYDSSVPEFTSPVVLANAENLATGGKWADAATVDPVCLGKRKTMGSLIREGGFVPA